MKKDLAKFLDRSQLPNDVEGLKDIIVLLAQKMDALYGELLLLKRFQYGQRSEKLKKKQ